VPSAPTCATYGTPADLPVVTWRLEAQFTEPTPMAGKTRSSARQIGQDEFPVSTSSEAVRIPEEEPLPCSSPPKSRPILWFATLVRAALGLCYSVLWIGGVYTYCLVPGTPQPRWAAPAFLWLAAAVAALSCRDMAPALLFAIGGFLAEVLGVHTGFPFGRYSYSNALGPSAAGVPVAIACAWLMLLLFARDLASRTTGQRWRAVATGAVIMTGFDLLIDPVATDILHYWAWEQQGSFFGVPFQNFAGWFAVSALLLAAVPLPQKPSNALAVCGASLIVFFALIAVCA
jgi:hypothetical protein